MYKIGIQLLIACFGALSLYANDLTNAKTKCLVFWGLEKQGIKAGLSIYTNCDTAGRLVIECVPEIESPITNKTWVWFPPVKSMCALALEDDNGPAQTTEKIKELGQPLTNKLFLKDGPNFRAGYSARQLVFGSEWPQQIGEKKIILNDYYTLTNGGRYHLTYTMKVIVIPKNWKKSLREDVPPIIDLAPVEAKFEIPKR